MTVRYTRVLFFSLVLLSSSMTTVHAEILNVGTGHQYGTLAAAANDAGPGDTVLVHGGIYGGGQFISNLQGTPEAPIVIMTGSPLSVRFSGGSEAWHLTDVAWLHIVGFEFTGQTGNMVNIDDGGTYDTPSHHVTIENCSFHDMAASGNNDLLKLSGLDSFQIRNCSFANGAAGGSGIDMVGCHYGIITGNEFSDMGSNSIQAKGGTQYLRIERNRFVNGGQRSVNLGGSTGLEFFRPIDATFEAADLDVCSNIFVGSMAPIAYVGSTRVRVVNNTIWKPEKWVARILQETVSPDRFVACGDNAFYNNIVVIDERVTTQVNVGSNTRPETFIFSNNLWYHSDNPSWGGPVLPVIEMGGVVGSDPLLVDPDGSNFRIPPTSPAVGTGFVLEDPKLDYYGTPFNVPPSIGAAEGNPPVTGVNVERKEKKRSAGDPQIRIAPNPTVESCTISYNLAAPAHIMLDLFDVQGKLIRRLSNRREEEGAHAQVIDITGLSGTILVRLDVNGNSFTSRIIAVNGINE